MRITGNMNNKPRVDQDQPFWLPDRHGDAAFSAAHWSAASATLPGCKISLPSWGKTFCILSVIQITSSIDIIFWRFSGSNNVPENKTTGIILFYRTVILSHSSNATLVVILPQEHRMKYQEKKTTGSLFPALRNPLQGRSIFAFYYSGVKWRNQLPWQAALHQHHSTYQQQQQADDKLP